MSWTMFLDKHFDDLWLLLVVLTFMVLMLRRWSR